MAQRSICGCDLRLSAIFALADEETLEVGSQSLLRVSDLLLVGHPIQVVLGFLFANHG